MKHLSCAVFLQVFLLLFPSSSEGAPKFQKAFTNIELDSPLFLTAVPGTKGATKLVAVVEQGGRILLIDTQSKPAKSHVFIDISTKVKHSGEQGLLGLAFAPEFPERNQVFLYYSPEKNPTLGTTATLLSSFEVKTDGDFFTALPQSEKVLMSFAQPARNHNGGMIAFKGENLYVGLGDGGGWNDNQGTHGQKISSWLASILRITPDYNGGYTIPSDNPFVGVQGAKEEIFAFGIRNPWRFSFDRKTELLWLGDVGQNKVEEISTVRSGENLGWSIYEGNIKCPGCPEGQTLTGGKHTKPVFTYTHDLGQSVTGGYVYRGKEHKSLIGHYLFADFVSGRVWKLTPSVDEKPAGPFSSEQITTISNIASFGEDAQGEIYAISLTEGVFRLVK